MEKTYENLSSREGLELTLWLSFLEEYINDALIQIKRWNRNKDAWDLHMFFVAVSCVDNAIVKLKRFWSYGKDYVSELEINEVLGKFRKNIKKYGIKEYRHDFIHRERIFENKDSGGRTISEYPVLILGGLVFNNGEFTYTFGTREIKISEAFNLVKKLRKDIKDVLDKKLKSFYERDSFESMVPYSHIRSFDGKLTFKKRCLRPKLD